MKRLFTLLATFALAITTTLAQQNYYFWENGKVTIEAASQVDSLTFSDGSWDFHFSIPESSDVTTHSFQALSKVGFIDNVQSITPYPEVGICFSDENSEPSYNDRRQIIGTSPQAISITLNNLVSGTTYYYRFYVKFFDKIYYSEICSVTTKGEKPKKPQDVVVNGHDFVDLGLPSNLLWAKTNVGAEAAYKSGDYFAWGETSSKSVYSEDTYKWQYPSYKYYYQDGKTTLEAEDDVATVKWGTGCRMPSSTEFIELCENCNWSWLSNYQGACGYLVTGINGNSVFFPASGSYDDYGFRDNPTGHYWSRSHDGITSDSYAYLLLFNEGHPPMPKYAYERREGYTVRPVAEK